MANGLDRAFTGVPAAPGRPRAEGRQSPGPRRSRLASNLEDVRLRVRSSPATRRLGFLLFGMAFVWLLPTPGAASAAAQGAPAESGASASAPQEQGDVTSTGAATAAPQDSGAPPPPPVEAQVSREEIGETVVASPFAMPSPVAWFRVFNKLGSPRWRQHYREPVSLTITDRHKAAIGLGAGLTDAFVAAESRGIQEARNVLLSIRALEKTLGISEKMHQRHVRLGELADAGQWPALRVELEAMMKEQASFLEEQRDGPLAELLPLGMLVRAIDLSSVLVRELELADEERLCIGDITLVIAMIRRVEALPEETLRARSVRDLRRCLKTVRDYWIADSPAVVADKVDATGRITREFLDSLHLNE